MIFIIIFVFIVITCVVLIPLLLTRQQEEEEEEKVNCSKIPYVLHKTGPFTELPDVVQETFETSRLHLKSKVLYSNDEDCRTFIAEHYDHKVLKAYDMLIPTAFKADLWRFCVLYVHGGIYSDIGHTILYEFDVNKGCPDMVLVKDAGGTHVRIQISFMATIPQNPFMLFAINMIVNDILMGRKNKTPLDITGPDAFGRAFSTYFNVDKVDKVMKLTGLDNREYTIHFVARQKSSQYLVNLSDGKKFIETKFKDYSKLVYNKRKHYSTLWKEDNIYHLSKKHT